MQLISNPILLQVSSNNTEVMTTIAAQVNPVTTAEVLTTAASLSIDENVFKNTSNLTEEDLQDGRVTLPYKLSNQENGGVGGCTSTPSPPPVPVIEEVESPVKPSAPTLEIIEPPPQQLQQQQQPQQPQEIRKQQIFETALIHSDSPTIRADPVCSKRPTIVDAAPKKKVRRSGSSGTVIEFVPLPPSQTETVEIDLTEPEPKHSIIVNNEHNVMPNIIQPAIRSIIKTKKTPHRNAYHGYFYVEEHAPPPPPHAYELQTYVPHQIVPMYPTDEACCTVYQDHLMNMNNAPIPLPRQGGQYDLYDYPKSSARIQEIPNTDITSYDNRKSEQITDLRKSRKKSSAEIEQNMLIQELQKNSNHDYDNPMIADITGYDTNQIIPYQDPPPPPPPHQSNHHQQEEVMESVVASRRRRKSKQKSLADEIPPVPPATYQTEPVNAPPPTEEEMVTHVMCKARQTRSKSCHSRSSSLKRSRRKLAPDEDLITVVTDDHCHNVMIPPQPKPRTSLGSKSGSLGNIMSEQYLLDESDPFTNKINRQTLPRRHVQTYDIEPPKPTPRKNTGYNRHPLSLSTETILFNDDKYDPNPIIPNRAPDIPDIWLPIRGPSVKA